MKDSPRSPSLRAALAKTTFSLWAICLFTSVGNVLFGYDVTSFAGVQSIPAFAHQFGSRDANGEWYLDAAKASWVGSIGFAGKVVGTASAPLVVEHLGHRLALTLVSCVTFIGAIIQTTSKVVAQFVVGRITIYFAVGMVENAVTTYQSELAPAGSRGMFTGFIQVFIQLGQILAAGVNRSYYLETRSRGWIIPCSIACVPAMTLLLGLYFIPDAPRWLISKGRHEDAVKSLKIVRPKADVINGHCEEEVDAIREALEQQIEKAPWLDLFKGTNLRRTTIATIVFIFHQFTGQGFVSQYSPRFYESVGLSDKAFDYTIASSAVGMGGSMIGLGLFDRFGRRPVMLVGAITQALFLFLVAGLGSLANPSSSETQGLVASVILFNFFYLATWAPLGYVLGSEIGTGALREKTMSFSSSINVISAFIVAFTVPYLLDAPYANLKAKIGWLFGGIAALSFFFAYFFVPEVGGRSLEELDEMFENKVPARKFASYETQGVAKRIRDLESSRRHADTDHANQDTKGAKIASV